MKCLAALLLFLACCAPTTPYITERNLDHWSRSWPRGNVDKVLGVHNPSPVEVAMEVFCQGDIFEGKSTHVFNVLPRKTVYAIVRVLAAYMVGDACDLVSWRAR